MEAGEPGVGLRFREGPAGVTNRTEARLVVFDLGRVLVRICDSWDHACECAGIARSGAPALDDAAREAATEWIGRYDSGEIDLDTFARAIAPFRGLRPEDVVCIHEVYLRGAYDGAAE